MLVACCDHAFGISTSRCSKTTSPRSLRITAERVSHSISSNGSTSARLNTRGNSSPFVRGASGSIDDWNIGMADSWGFVSGMLPL